ncbi:MAG: LPXTG cell wall anchor domain-containing protein [Hespellia sp.]|nr:LPXTG cell wall anchor domain-containing protein [Hespellia sp.]
MQYSVDGGANWIDVTDTTMNITGVTAANGVQVYDKGDGVATSASDVQTITVTQAAQPAGLTKTDCSTAANNNGKISGVNSTMEYRVSGSTAAWTAITGTTITGLPNQSYDIRVKASGTVLASEAENIEISAYVAPPTPTAADYTDVDKAISEIPADLSVYTSASVQALNDAKAAVDRNKTQAEQTIVDGYATAIRDAIKALKYKGADYSKVDTAIGKIPADLSIYTDASVKALNDAKNAVVRGKNITEQKTVDGYAAAIQKAIDGLVKKTSATDKGNTNNDSNKAKNVTTPQTGDDSNMFLWLAILMLSAGGIVTVGITQKTRKKNSKQ